MIGIIGALSNELELIKNKMKNINTENSMGNVFYNGEIANEKVVVAECSIGKVNATVTATLMIAKYNPDIIINTGIAGSMNDNLHVMDVLIANKVSLHDEGEVFKRYYPFETSFEIDNKWVNLARQAFFNTRKNNMNELNIGEVVTGDEYVESELKKQEIKNRFCNAYAVDMECGAIAKVCYRSEKELVIIKTISDEADDDAKISYDKFIDKASISSANIVLELIKICNLNN